MKITENIMPVHLRRYYSEMSLWDVTKHILTIAWEKWSFKKNIALYIQNNKSKCNIKFISSNIVSTKCYCTHHLIVKANVTCCTNICTSCKSWLTFYLLVTYLVFIYFYNYNKWCLPSIKTSILDDWTHK